MSIYMDDRTVVTNRRDLLLWAMEEWHEWSGKVGLRENLDKRAIVLAGAVKKEEKRSSCKTWKKEDGARP